MKKIYLLSVVVLLAVLFISPFSIPTAVSTASKISSTKADYEAMVAQRDSTASELSQAQSQFESARTFSVDYRDAKSVATVLATVSGFSVESIKMLDVNQGYAEIGDYTPSTTQQFDGLKVSVRVNDMQRALDIISSMQLPIISLSARNGVIDVSFNTGRYQ